MPPILCVAEDTTHTMLMTVAVAISAGAILIVIARRLNIPAIVILLVGGIVLGPDFWKEFFGGGAPVQPDSLGDGLKVIVSLAIGLILFEGGLTLDTTGYRSAPTMIKQLLTLGVGVTWLGTAMSVAILARVFGVDLSAEDAILAGSLVIVTGPTVIAPLLKRIKVDSRLHSILHWEGVLIDPIGVFIVLLCYEFFFTDETGLAAIVNFGIRVGWGVIAGALGGFALWFFIKRRFVPEELINVFALGAAVLVFSSAEFVRSETGLLAVTVAGFVFGLSKSSKLKQVKQFKAEITDLLIGTLFILLAARLEFSQFRDFGWHGVLSVAVVMFLIRPISVLLCSVGAKLSMREKLFLSWVAPRGIVAASMASLIALRLGDRFVETFTYSVIIGTILLQGSTADILAVVLKVKRPKPADWLIVGGHVFARRIVEFITRNAGVRAAIIDSNPRAVREAAAEGLRAINADARDTALIDRMEYLQGIGHVLALTDNEDLNVRICQNWSEVVGPGNVYRCDPTDTDALSESEEPEAVPGRIVWPRLPRPTLVSREIENGDSLLIQTEDIADVRSRDAVPLYLLAKNRLLIDPQDLDDDSEGTLLCLQRKADYLLRALRPELIFSIKVESLQELLEAMMDRMVQVQPRVPRDEVVAELLERETVFPTVLGHGVAVPHTYSGVIEDRMCALARVQEGGVRFAPDAKENVDLVFLLLSPQGDPEGHLATLAEIARLVIRSHVREQLRAAGTPLEVVRIVRDHATR